MKAIKEISFNDSSITVTLFEDNYEFEYFKPSDFMNERQLKKWKLSTCFNAIQTMIDTECLAPQDSQITFNGEEYFYTEFLPYALIYADPCITYEFLGHLRERFAKDISESSSSSEDNLRSINIDDDTEDSQDEGIAKLENRIDKLEDLITNLAKDIKSLKPRRR